MKTFVNYLYYRISKFYEDWGESDGHTTASIVVAGSFGFITLSFIIFIYYYFFDTELTVDIIMAIGILFFGNLSLFLTNKKKFIKLSEKYKDEKNSKLKGWLVFLYVIGSVVLYFVTMYLCDY